MQPTKFDEMNIVFGPPDGYSEQHVRSVPAFSGQITIGPFEGTQIAITAWKPSPEELAELNRGAPVFISFIGGLPPHYVGTSFNQVLKVI